jgi:hypothetical protein
MKIPDEVRKAVGFVMYLDQVSKELVPVGSCFFLGHDPKDGAHSHQRFISLRLVTW